MNQSPLHSDEDQDSLFGSPPPSPARGRSPSQETFAAEGDTRPTIAVPNAGMGRKNVGTIALPGSHMSCAELPANLPASGLSLSRPTSSHDSSGSVPPHVAETPASIVTSRSSTRSGPSRTSSAVGIIPSTSASTRKHRTSKSKSSTPISPTPPITLPGPNEPTPPNFLRSQSSLLGLAGLVGCVKPAQLYTHDPQPTTVQHSHSRSPIRGSTSNHPIVLDDDPGIPRIGKHQYDEPPMPQNLDQLDPETLRSNFMASLTKEKNIFPVLESLVKLLGGEPYPLPESPPPQTFARPYGHGIFNVQPAPPVCPLSSLVSSTSIASSSKRRKLKHVPAGATDWDVPFPFAAGEGPKAYRDTWAQDRAKQLVTQLLELVQSATKRAAIKTAKSGGKASKERDKAQNRHSSRSASVETQIGQTDSSQANVCESSSHTGLSAEAFLSGIPMDGLRHYLDSLDALSTTGSPASGSQDRMSVDSERAAEEAGSVAPGDYSTFEEWLSQFQQFVSDSSASSPALDIDISTQHVTRDEVIDPALLALSQPQHFRLTTQLRSATLPKSALVPGDIAQILDVSPPPPALAHSPRTSLSSLTEPLTPLSEAFADVPTSTISHQDPLRDLPTHQPVDKDCASEVQAMPPTEPREPSRITAAQKGKARADESVASMTPSALSRSTPISKCPLNKQAILERARERRKQLVAEIERTRIEIWETAVENAVLVHFTRDGLV